MPTASDDCVLCFLGSELGRASLAQRTRNWRSAWSLIDPSSLIYFIYSLLTHRVDTQGRQLLSLWASHGIFLCWYLVFLLADLVPLLLGPVPFIFHLSAFPESKFVSDPLVFISLKWHAYIIYTYVYPVDCGSVLYMYRIILFSMVNLDAFGKMTFVVNFVEWLIPFSKSSTDDQHKVTWASFRAYSGIHQCAWCFECLKVAWHMFSKTGNKDKYTLWLGEGEEGERGVRDAQGLEKRAWRN